MKILQQALKLCVKCQQPRNFVALTSTHLKKYSTAGIGLDDDLLGFSDEQKEVSIYLLVCSIL